MGDSLTSDEPDELIQLNFKVMVNHYLRLLDNSKLQLDDAKKFYWEATSNLHTLETRLVHYKEDVEAYIRNENNELTQRVDEIRRIAYPIGVICIIFLPICPLAYLGITLGVEINIGYAKEAL